MKVRNFLGANPGSIPIDVYTSHGTITMECSHIPPVKATQVLKNAAIGPGGALIPNKQDAIDLIAYHILYHGVTEPYSINPQITITVNEQNNKYLRVIRPLCDSLNMKSAILSKRQDLYIASAGWRPALDTLNKIAAWNSWVRDISTTFVEVVPFTLSSLKKVLNRIIMKNTPKMAS